MHIPVGVPQGEDGVAVTGKNTIDGKEYTVDENGKFVRGSFVEEVVKDKKGKDVTITRYYTAGGSYALMWQEIDGNLYYFQNSGKEMGRMLSGGQWIITTRGKNTKRRKRNSCPTDTISKSRGKSIYRDCGNQQ